MGDTKIKSVGEMEKPEKETLKKKRNKRRLKEEDSTVMEAKESKGV